MMEIRALSYNIHNGIGVDGHLDLDRTGDLIARLDPDVVGLQEVDRHFRSSSNYTDQLARLSEDLEMEAEFGPAIEHDATQASGGHPKQYGIGVLSEFSIDDANVVSLDSDPEVEPRVLLETTLDVGDDVPPLRFCTTHLATTQTARERQVKELLATVEEPTRQVVVGDFNATPASPTIDAITEQFDDAFAQTGSDDVRTFPTPYVEPIDGSSTHRVSLPDRRIDYVFYSPEITCCTTRRVESLASDHSAVVADLTIPEVTDEDSDG
ncbi:endonuclease/exonuclease/phosphatase family protein [Halorussus salinisoli]|uniref:endonuclease/exonuclease/phosphatase family protein n=1 Tax=Halorussus salinisoli TaxID=2558242 RepID=UPI0010C1AE0B|nr:endonuclease/exonuclease/phosphatase family protein [Halorussus salinisoli]